MDEVEVPINTETPRAVSAIVRRGNRYLLVLRANPPAQNMFAFPVSMHAGFDKLEARGW